MAIIKSISDLVGQNIRNGLKNLIGQPKTEDVLANIKNVLSSHIGTNDIKVETDPSDPTRVFITMDPTKVRIIPTLNLEISEAKYKTHSWMHIVTGGNLVQCMNCNMLATEEFIVSLNVKNEAYKFYYNNNLGDLSCDECSIKDVIE